MTRAFFIEGTRGDYYSKIRHTCLHVNQAGVFYFENVVMINSSAIFRINTFVESYSCEKFCALYPRITPLLRIF